MPTKKRRATPYQYEPLVTPGNWRGDELRYAVRLTQIVDDLYQKYSSLKNARTQAAEPEEPTDSDMQSILSAAYPIGSIYLSLNDTDPAELFGGIWEQIKDAFLLTAGDVYTAGETGGESEHTLTVEEMPTHTHPVKSAVAGGNNIGYAKVSASGNVDDPPTMWTTGVATTVGGSQPHNNMPPYLAVYAWKRTA